MRNVLNNQKKFIFSTSKGFTLIEVMVAVSIFAIVTTVGIGALMNVNSAYGQSRLQRAAIDNISFAMESMAREIRIGKHYTDGMNVIDNPQDPNYRQNEITKRFSFTSFDINNDGVIDNGDHVTYYYEDSNGYGAVAMNIDGMHVGDLTSPNVNVTGLWFMLEELDGSSPKQPYITIHIAAEAVRGDQSTEVVLQTSVSQREIDMN